MKWGYIITFISKASGKTACYKFKNTRIIEMKLPHVEIKSTKPNIEPLGGAKN